MKINLTIPDMQELKPRITVFGVGGAGGNAVNNMIESGLEGVEFVVANTDAQALALSKAERIIQLGVTVTEGLGAGSHPEVGRAAAEESFDEINDHLSGSHMVFITAGMGGGTGTGAAPVVARAAREQGILTVGVVTKPFQFEGNRRLRLAEEGIDELYRHVDTLIVIPNQNLFRVANEKTTFSDAFSMADEVLFSGVACVTDLMTKEGIINLDFADVRSVMRGMGKAMMGTGEASGDDRASHAADAAISNPLLDDVSMQGARGLIVSITGGHDLTLHEVEEAAGRIREQVDADANIILGATYDDKLEGSIRVSVVATGTDAAMVQAMDPVQPSVERTITVDNATIKTSNDQRNIENQAKSAVSNAINTQQDRTSANSFESDGVVVEPYVPSSTPSKSVDEIPMMREEELPKVHIPSKAIRPEVSIRKPRVEELAQVTRNETVQEPVNTPRAMFKRLASNVGRSLMQKPQVEQEAQKNQADDAAARNAIEAGAGMASRRANNGAVGKMDMHGRANEQQFQKENAQMRKDHQEIPSFLRKRS